MRLLSILPKNFGNLPDKKIEFGNGLTIIRGPNEAGKTFSIEAITQALYGDASSTAAILREHCRKWGSAGPFSLEMEIESKGKKFVIIRDFESKQNLLTPENESSTSDKEFIRKQISELVGLPSQIAFEVTACIPQEEVSSIGEAGSTVREIIEGRLAGSGSDTDKLAKQINKVLERMRSKSGKLGEIVKLEGQISILIADLSAKTGRLKDLAINKSDLEALRLTLQRITAELADKRNALKGSQEYITAKARYEKASESYDLYQENLNKFRKAKEAINIATEKIGPLKSTQEGVLKQIEKGEAYLSAAGKCEELSKKASEIRKRTAELEALEAEISKVRRELSSIRKVDDEKLNNARNIPGEISGLKHSLAEQLFGIRVDLEKKIEFSILSDGIKVEGSEAEMHAEAAVIFPGLAAVYVKNLTGAGMPLIDEIRRKEGVLEKILQSYQVDTLADLESLREKGIQVSQEESKLLAKRDALLGGENLKEMQAGLEKIEEKLARVAQEKEALTQHACTATELVSSKAFSERLAKEIKEFDGTINKNSGTLEAIGGDEEYLTSRKKEAVKELAVAEASLEEKRVYECTPQGFAKLSRETNDLDKELKKHENRQVELRVKIDQETISTEDVAAIEEKLLYVSNAKSRLNHKYEVLKAIQENIVWARHNSILQISQRIEKQMGGILSDITGGKYDLVRLDQDLRLSLFAKEKGGFIDIDDKIDRFSSGTVDQVYLAARIALLGLLAVGEKPPIILDDTFVSFDDMGRKTKAFEILKSLAKSYQVLYFTCHDSPVDANTIELS